MAQEQEQQKLPDTREPRQVPLPENIDKLRAEIPGLQDAWRVFQGSPVLSEELKQLMEQHLKEYPDTIDPATGKIRAEELKKLFEQLRKRDITFEVIAVNNRAVALQHRLKARFALAQEPPPPPHVRKGIEEQMAMMQRSEILWTVCPRLIRRCLQTLDRYAVLRNRYNYPGLERNAALEKTVSQQVAALQQAMQRRIKAAQAPDSKVIEDTEKQIYGITSSLPLQVNELYMEFLDRALMRNAELYRAGRDVNPTLFPQLDAHRAEILLEGNAFQLHMGLQMVRDIELLQIPDVQRTFVIPADATNLPPPFLWQLDAERDEKFLQQTVGGISENFRRHFDDVLGRRRPGQPPRTRPGLLEHTWGMTAERLFTEHGRMMALRLCNGLALYRGAVRWGAVEGVRLPLRALFGLVPGGATALDMLVPPGQTPEEYRREILNPILRQLGLPDGFDFSAEAWRKLENDPVARERFRRRMQSVSTIIEESTKEIQNAVRDFETDLDILSALRGKYSREHLVGADVDEQWVKQHPRVTLADIQALRSQDGPQILAAHVVLFRQMRGHWTTYTMRMNLTAERILQDNVEVHLKMEKVLKEAGEKMQEDDNWLFYIACGALAYYVSAQTLGRIGRYGGVSGTAGPVGLGGRWLPRVMTAGRYNPLAILNAPTRPINWLLGPVSAQPLAGAAPTTQPTGVRPVPPGAPAQAPGQAPIEVPPKAAAPAPPPGARPTPPPKPPAAPQATAPRPAPPAEPPSGAPVARPPAAPTTVPSGTRVGATLDRAGKILGGTARIAGRIVPYLMVFIPGPDRRDLPQIFVEPYNNLLRSLSGTSMVIDGLRDRDSADKPSALSQENIRIVRGIAQDTREELVDARAQVDRLFPEDQLDRAISGDHGLAYATSYHRRLLLDLIGDLEKRLEEAARNHPGLREAFTSNEAKLRAGRQLMRNINANDNTTYFTKQYGLWSPWNPYLYMQFKEEQGKWLVNRGSLENLSDPGEFSNTGTGAEKYNALVTALNDINNGRAVSVRVYS